MIHADGAVGVDDKRAPLVTIHTGPSNVLATCDTVNVPPAVAWTLVVLRIVAYQTPFDVSRNVTVYVPREAT